MSHLALSVLGPFTGALDTRPLTGFDSNKARALLVYLALESDRVHARSTLAGLLWPDRSEPNALANLRYTLANLRTVLGDRTLAQAPYLLVTNSTVQFDPASDHRIDAIDFLALSQTPPDTPGVGQPAADRLMGALDLYHGDFLDGFTTSDAAPFDEWMLFRREQLDRRLCRVLQQLADFHEQQGDFAAAEHFVRLLLAREPYAEEAHRQLMRILARSGRRCAALAQYQLCRDLLGRDLGVAPAQATIALNVAIAEGW